MWTTLMVGVAAILFALPLIARADQVSAQTQQILPLGSQTCQNLQVLDAQSYVYDGALNSFDLTVADPSYVSVLGSVGDVGLQLGYMSRRINPDGTLRIHVDTPSIQLYGETTITLTLISAKQGSPVCVAAVYITVPAPTHSSQPTSPQAIDSPVKTTISKEEQGSAAIEKTSISMGAGTQATSSSTHGLPNAALSSLPASLSRLCARESTGYELWLMLFAVYMALNVLLVLTRGDRAPGSAAAIILIPLVALIAFWYAVPECRTSPGMPLLAAVIAAAGLFGLNQGRGEETSMKGTKALMVQPTDKKRSDSA